MNMKKSLSTALVPFVFIGTVILANNAMAAIDTTAVTGAITDAGTAVGVVGADCWYCCVQVAETSLELRAKIQGGKVSRTVPLFVCVLQGKIMEGYLVLIALLGAAWLMFR